MHGAVVAIDNKAYMFTANSGVGKTTRAKLWLNEYPDSIIVNGDKPLIKITENIIIGINNKRIEIAIIHEVHLILDNLNSFESSSLQ